MNQELLQVEKFTYYGQWPEEPLKVVRAVLDDLGWIVPAWANEVYVGWSPHKKGGATISCGIEYDYRRVNLTFYPAFLSETEDYRVYMVIHDLLHGFSSVLADYAESTIRELIPVEEAAKFHRHALRELEMRHEQWTQDLAWCLYQKLTGKLPLKAPRQPTDGTP